MRRRQSCLLVIYCADPSQLPILTIGYRLQPSPGIEQGSSIVYCTYEKDQGGGMVYMERPIEPNMGPSLADVLLCTFESTNAGFSSFPVRKLLS